MRHTGEIGRHARAESARRPGRQARGLSGLAGACRLAATVLGICCAAHGLPALGQCDFEWGPADGLPGVEGVVEAMTTWDTDGEGPLPELLVVGGSFRAAGKIRANNIAAWDGSAWQALGEGVDFFVQSIAVFDGQLVVGGWPFAGDGVNAVSRWDGSEWHTIAHDLEGVHARVHALYVFDGELIAGGYFSSINGVAANSLARWDGQSWHAFDPELLDYQGFVFSLAEFNNDLVVGGYFSNAAGGSADFIARWDGKAWNALGTGFNQWVEALAVYEDELIAAGYFWMAGDVVIRHIARWDGETWQPLGTGFLHMVYALIEYDGLLIAAGDFGTAGGTSASRIAAWDGTSWSSLGEGIGGDLPSRVDALAAYQGMVFAGGHFQIGGTGPALSIAQWNGSNWNPLGVGLIGEVSDWCIHEGQLIAIGNNNPNLAFSYIARREAEEWRLVWWGADASVFECESHGGDMVVGGRFPTIGGIDANHVARWDGEAWHALGSGLSGQNAFAYAMTNYKGDLIVGGRFAAAGGVPASNIARWDGSQWHAMGDGVNGFVQELIVVNGELIASGNFTMAGGVMAKHIARWNGASWQPLGDETACYYSAPMAALDNELLAVGPICGFGSPYSISKWNGTEWTTIAKGLDGYVVHAMAVLNGDIFVAGSFTSQGGEISNCLARWNGSHWDLLGAELVGEGWCLQAYNGTLMIGGQIPFPHEGITMHYFYAQWGPDCAPGDVNCDGLVDVDDVAPFVQALLASEDASDCTGYLANVNGDVWPDGGSRLDAGDISAFVAALTGM